MSASELGTETRTSNATVIRTLQALGYSGLAELKAKVAGPFIPSTPPEVRARRRVESAGGDLQKVWDSVTTESIDRIELLRRNFSLERYQRAVQFLLDAQTITTYGFGAAFVVAEHLALKLGRMGRRTGTIRASGFNLADELLKIERGDVVVLFAPNRFLADVDVLVDRTRVVGATSLLISDEVGSRLGETVTLELYAPNTPTGLTGEPLSTMVLADALAQGVAASDVERTVESSHTLTTLRQQLGFR